MTYYCNAYCIDRKQIWYLKIEIFYMPSNKMSSYSKKTQRSFRLCLVEGDLFKMGNKIFYAAETSRLSKK